MPFDQHANSDPGDRIEQTQECCYNAWVGASTATNRTIQVPGGHPALLLRSFVIEGVGFHRCKASDLPGIDDPSEFNLAERRANDWLIGALDLHS
jgi:hypothetical protein